MEPEVLVLDEPSSNLDPRARREFGEILTGLTQTIILVTHDLPYAHEICERSVIIDGGQSVGLSPDMAANPDLKARPEVLDALVKHVRSLAP